MTSDPRTIPAALDRFASQLPDHDALITNDRSFTAAGLRDEVHRAAAALIGLGVRAGDRIAIWSPNTWHWVVACLAIHHAGAAMVPLNTRYTASEASDILFTSGTTGRSKGVLCAHRQSLSGSASWAANGEITSADRYLCINPFFHNFGYKAGILACLQTGAPLIPHLTFDPLATLQAIEQHRITVLPGPPTIYQTLLDHPARGDYDLRSLRFAVTGAATVPVVLVERMQSELDIDIVLTAYGLTEANGMGTMCRADDDAVTVATTCGRPFADNELRIDDSGEVLLRGPNIMLRYLDDPEATAAAVDADGWLHTGDIGEVDERGNPRITDRLKDMYICGGFNVYPAEIEQVLARMGGVADAAVIGVPDERLGEVGRAFVVPRPGSELEEASVIAYTREHLANFKAPRSVRFVDALPRNAGGKVVKPQLRELA